MAEPSKKRRARRKHSPAFKLAAVKRVIEKGEPMTRVAKEIDVASSALSRWVEKVRTGEGLGRKVPGRKPKGGARKLNLAIPLGLPVGLRAEVTDDLASDRRHRASLKTELAEVRAERDALQRILARMMRDKS